MPLNRELLRKVQALLSLASRGLSKGQAAAAEEETAAKAMLSARWASNASASTSMTFASSSSVRKSPAIVASLSRYCRDDHFDMLRRGREIYSIAGGGIVAHDRRSLFTRTAATAAGSSGERNTGGKKRSGGSSSSSSKERRRSSSTSTSTPKRRILPSEMPRLPPLPRGGQRQWRTLLEDEVRGFFFFFSDALLLLLAPLFKTSSSVTHLFPSPSSAYNPRKKQKSTLSARRTSRRRSARS